MQIRGRIFTAVSAGIAGCLLLVSVAMDQSAAAADQVASPSIQAQAGEKGDIGQVETRAIRQQRLSGTCSCSTGDGSCTYDESRPKQPACTKGGSATCSGVCSIGGGVGPTTGAQRRARETMVSPSTTTQTDGGLLR
jgi:hypothetical protein